MQTVTGRLTANAKVNELKDGRKVVHFTVAENHRYKTKGATEVTETVNYFDVSYWMRTGIAPYLTKGTVVEVTGHLGVNAWVNKDGEAKANITLHANFIKLHTKAPNTNGATVPAVVAAEENPDDLPF